MLIQVTREHIKNGVALSPDRCAIALAIDPFNRIAGALVGIDGLFSRDFEIEKLVCFPMNIQEFITSHDGWSAEDRDQFLDPIEFRLSAECFMR